MANLERYGCISVTGDDAGDFLQGQLSSDVLAIPTGGGQLSSFNDPKGRVLALPRVIRVPDGFQLLLPRPLCETTARRLSMFVLRARVSIRFIPDIEVCAASGDEVGERLGDAGIPAIHIPGTPGIHMWAHPQGAAEPPASLDRLSDDNLALAETRLGVPEIYPETAGQFVAQMLDLDRLGAISYEKGCYVGQEVIARAHHLGRIKRHLARFTATGACAPGDPVLLKEKKVGVIVRRAPGAGVQPALAVMKEGVAGELSAGSGSLAPPQ